MEMKKGQLTVRTFRRDKNISLSHSSTCTLQLTLKWIISKEHLLIPSFFLSLLLAAASPSCHRAKTGLNPGQVFIAGVFWGFERKPETPGRTQTRRTCKLPFFWNINFSCHIDFKFYFETLPHHSSASLVCFPICLIRLPQPDCVHLFPITLCL